MEITIKIERERLADLMTCAMEGGIGYWGTVIEYVAPPDGASSTGYSTYISYPMCEAGGGIVLGDTESRTTADCYDADAAFKPVTVTYAKLVEGVAVMAHNQPRHFWNFLEGKEDAETGDVFMQCVCFGKVVFG